jgi:L-lactate dehydrogenase complex protein LldF
MNVCPVYERVGGHAYGSVYPGPIGIVLTPQMRGIDSALDRSLPFASTLCYACAEVCPVRIPLPELIIRQRHRVAVAKSREARPHLEPVVMRLGRWVFGSGRRWGLALRVVGVGARLLGKRRWLGPMPWPASLWTRARDLPAPPGQSFREWWSAGRGAEGRPGSEGQGDVGGSCSEGRGER